MNIAKAISIRITKIIKSSRTEFFYEYFLPLISIVSAVICINCLMTLNLNKSNLQNNAGVVTEIRDTYDLTKSRYSRQKENHSIVIGLKNQEKGFVLSEGNEVPYLSLVDQIIVGESINIYTSGYFLSYLQSSNKIYQIEKKGRVLFSLESIKQNSATILWYITFCFVGRNFYLL